MNLIPIRNHGVVVPNNIAALAVRAEILRAKKADSVVQEQKAG